MRAADAGTAHHARNEEGISSLAASIMNGNILGQWGKESSLKRLFLAVLTGVSIKRRE